MIVEFVHRSEVKSPAQTRTWIAALSRGSLVPQDATGAVGTAAGGVVGDGTRSARKAAAFAQVSHAELAARRNVEPQLTQMVQRGMLGGYEFIPLTGTVALRAPEARAGAAWQAIRGVAGLGRIVRDKPISNSQLQSGSHKFRILPGPTVSAEQAWQVSQVGADTAWKGGATGDGVVIGFVDSGADITHPALKNSFRGTRADGTVDSNYNFVDFVSGRKDVHDGWGHGTNTSSVAVGSDPAHSTGIAPGAKFIAARVFGGGESSIETRLKGLSWMLAPTDSEGKNPDPSKAPDIVNMSFGGRDADALRYLDAIKGFHKAGIVPVAAAGNGGKRGPGSILMPAAFPETIAAGFTDKNDVISPRSAQGPTAVASIRKGALIKPDIVAPGEGVVGALIGGGYGELSGSSMSSAITSGAAAILLGKYPTLTPDQVRQALSTSARDLGEPGPDFTHGNGRIDIPAALKAAAKIVAAGAAAKMSA